ncbi:adenine phosphoribosyltransferase [Nakamurella deserti]|uniref:adenine phosphoribosyltransferase n=1 Tax=Nakamurella deserti TaxID=2164074 RepID=UPI000DBE9232|nr:adenine phosphoribosyltransferase [Nakamurella deserti]
MAAFPPGADRRVDLSGHDRASVTAAAAAQIERLTRVVPDFPVPGVLFRDVTPVFTDGAALALVAGALAATAPDGFDLVAGLDARGFLLGGAVAAICGSGVLAVRKPGKLAGAVIGQDYALEYGTARLELHPDDVPDGARVLVVDDVLATGGTAAAACSLIGRAGGRVIGVALMTELVDLGGRAVLAAAGVDAVTAICAV